MLSHPRPSLPAHALAGINGHARSVGMHLVQLCVQLAAHHVPVFTDNGHALLKKFHQNNTMMEKILRLIDGNRFAREIAIYATVSLSLVLQALRHLL